MSLDASLEVSLDSALAGSTSEAVLGHAPCAPDTAWFTRDRLGLFVHWGLYALGARHEWVMSRERMSVADYERYAAHFDPDLFDAHEWAAAAKAAGMRYVVLTTKHHDGFCLWDSALTEYTVMRTPFGRDVVAEFVAAVREAGLKVGFYHSLLDWHHPHFPIDGHHPLRDDPNVAELNAGRDVAVYREYLHGQVRELLTNYGRIDYLFFDFSYGGEGGGGDAGGGEGATGSIWGGKGAPDWGAQELLETVRELQPGILVNDRLGIPGDFVTPEQYQPDRPMEVDGQQVRWEACQTLNGSWGYDRDNDDYKSVDLLVRMLIDGVSSNGNLLLNVGPNGRGAFDPNANAALAGLGEWMRLHDRSIYDAGPSTFTPPRDVRYTQSGNRLYAHLFAWPFQTLHLRGLAGSVTYAQLLNDASELKTRVIDPGATAQNLTQGGQPEGTLTLTLPVQRPDVAVPVIELFLTN
ncbi:alpha-L-fucosidase [Humibacter albus]|uniref:alpha-L-fucosidase n=1 Tax=Humibacter albus TaxID=427754 RepID=UPI0003B7425F|nr:alpha-L-fucosidase [Humibacter albus]